LKNYEWNQLSVIGNTDDIGSVEDNQQLSEKRADSVKKYLYSQGVPVAKIVSIGLGENKPIDTNVTPEGRQNNRRVEFLIKK
jgi:outer membrane protein OmpA-like peptidoglycan-associated protein